MGSKEIGSKLFRADLSVWRRDYFSCFEDFTGNIVFNADVVHTCLRFDYIRESRLKQMCAYIIREHSRCMRNA